MKIEGQEGANLPRVTLPASSSAIENVLPAAYHRPINHLRSKTYQELAAALELAHRLNLSTSIELLAVCMEAQ